MKVFRDQLGATVVLACLEVTTGMALLVSYGSSATSAYSSTKVVESSAFLGFVQSFHHWLSAGLIVSAWVTIWIGLIGGGYRQVSRREWVIACLFIILSMLFQLTGHILPWDVHAVRTAVVESGIAQGAPGVGVLQANLIRGGPTVGPQTLHIWFISHVALLTLGLIVMAALILPKLRGLGIKKFILYTSIVYIVVFGTLALLDHPHVGAMATPVDYGMYDAAPEWYILPMHEMLAWADSLSPSLGFVGTMVAPTAILILILIAPWIDRKTEKRHLYGIVLGTLTAVGLIGLTAYGCLHEAVASPAGPNAYAKSASSGPSEVDKVDPTLVAQGQKLFSNSGCTNCHTLNGKGGNAGPVLNGAGTRHPQIEWQIAHLDNPKSKSPNSTMPSFSYLGLDSEKAVAEYLTTLK